jgi:transcription factor C subunit 7
MEVLPVANSDCSHLSMGEERGWHFHGDESFDSYGPGQTGGPPGMKTSDGGMMEDTEPRPSSPAAKL